MAQPTQSDVHIDAALTDMSIAYMQAEANYVAGRVFPPKPVGHQTNKYHIFTKNDWFRDDAVLKRTTGQKAPRAGFTLSNAAYDCTPWWTACPLSELVRANADPSLPLDVAAMRIVTTRMMIWRERLFATQFMGTSIWGTDSTPATLWDDAASDPEANVMTGKKTVLQNTGLEPNTLIVGFSVHQALKRHPLIKDRFKYTSSESITNEMLARFFEVDRYEVCKAVYATNNEGAAAAYSFAIGLHALLCYQNGSAGIMEPNAVTNFVWSGLTGQNDVGVRIDQFYDPDLKEDVVRGEFAFDMKVVGSDLGYFFNSAVSA